MKENFEKNYVQIPEEPEEEKPKYGSEIDSLLIKLEEERRKPQLPSDEVRDMLYEIEEKYPYVEKKIGNEDVQENSKFNEIIDKIGSRLKKELNDAEGIEALKELPKLYSPLLSKLLYDENKVSKKSSQGSYFPFLDKIALPPRHVRRIARSGMLLCSLLNKGVVTKSTETLHHEIIHAKHTNREKQFRKALDAYLFSYSLIFLGPAGDIAHTLIMLPYLSHRAIPLLLKRQEKKILKEAHASRGSKRYSDHNQSLKDIYDKYADNIIKTDEDKDQFITADQQLKQLYSLNCKDDEIGKLVDKAKWDKKELVYDELDKRIKELMKEQNISKDDLNDLVLIDDLKRKLYFLHVKDITREEIKKAYEDIKEDELKEKAA